MNIPIVKLEFQSMRQTLAVALQEHLASLDADFQAAIAKVCSEEAVTKIVEDEARKQVQAVLREEVASFFRYSAPGRQAIHDAVHERLNEIYPLKEDT